MRLMWRRSRLEDDKRKKWWKIPDGFSVRNIRNIKNIKKDQLLILFLAGILLLVISLPVDRNKETDGGSRGGFLTDGNEESVTGRLSADDMDTYLYRLETRLADALSQMSGVGEVAVMITLKSSAERVVEKDTEITDEGVTESDSQGGTRTTKNNSRAETTIYSDGNTSGTPYVSKELTPEVEGVMIIAEGGDEPVVKQNITEAVQALFGIDTHKIRIMKKSSK